jgi:hypothetical protein
MSAKSSEMLHDHLQEPILWGWICVKKKSVSSVTVLKQDKRGELTRPPPKSKAGCLLLAQTLKSNNTHTTRPSYLYQFEYNTK